MNKTLRLFLVPVLAAAISVIAHPAVAGNVYAIAGQTTAVIIPDDGSGVTCVGINNYHPQGIAVFVPADTMAEWTAFKTHMQSYVQIVDCPNCPAGSITIQQNQYGAGGTQSYPAFPPGQNYTVTWPGDFIPCVGKLPPGWGVCVADAGWSPSTAVLQCSNNKVTLVSGSYGQVGGAVNPATSLTIADDGLSGAYYQPPTSGSSGGGQHCGNGDVSSGCSDGAQNSQTEQTSGDNFGPSSNGGGGGGGGGGSPGGYVTVMTLN